MNSIDTFDNKEDNDGNQDGDKVMGQSLMANQVNSRTENDWVTTGQAKQMLGVSSVNTVKRWVSEGKLDAKKFGANGWMRISVESIRRLREAGDENVRAFQRLKQRIDSMADLDVDLKEENLEQMSDRKMGKLPWEK